MLYCKLRDIQIYPIPLSPLSKTYVICNLNPYTFHPNDTHLDYNNTFLQGSSMILNL